MSTSAPLLRPPIPGSGRSSSGTRTPRLGLAIPPSPSARPVNPDSQQTEGVRPSRPALPSLSLNTPSGTGSAPQEGRPKPRMPPLSIVTPQTSANASDTSRGTLRSQSSSELPSATSSQSNVGEIADADLPDLAQLSLEKGRPLDVEDLDDAGWKAASKDGKIREMGCLGEGAGGAVTRCILQGGKTVFALKVRLRSLAVQQIHC